MPSLSVITEFVSTEVQSTLGRSVPAKLGMGNVVAARMLLPVALHFVNTVWVRALLGIIGLFEFKGLEKGEHALFHSMATYRPEDGNSVLPH